MNLQNYVELAKHIQSAADELLSARRAVAAEPGARSFRNIAPFGALVGKPKKEGKPAKKIPVGKLKAAAATWEPYLAGERRRHELAQVRRAAIDRAADAGKVLERLFPEFADETVSRWRDEQPILEALRPRLNSEIWQNEGLEAVIDWARRTAKRASAEQDGAPQTPVQAALLPANHFADLYGIPTSRLESARRDGRLKKCKKLNGRWYFNETEIRSIWPEDFIESPR
jgi:hypothetical protein